MSKLYDHAISVLAVGFGLFAISFISGAAYIKPATGAYYLAPLDCSELEGSAECQTSEGSLHEMAPSANRCDASMRLVELMIKCRASAIDGLGREEACNDGDTWLPRDTAILDKQIPLLASVRDQNCALADDE